MPLSVIPANSAVRRCILCNRNLLKAVTEKQYNDQVILCRHCIHAGHTIGTPCPPCNGEYHFPPGESTWGMTTNLPTS